jgi:hypothetical protein
MNLQEKMFAEVEAWKANQMTSVDGFRELDSNGWKEVKLSKVLEIEAPSGVKTTVFA